MPRLLVEMEEWGEDFSTLASGTERILMVDDEIPLLEVGKRGLERLGYSVTTKSMPLDALREFFEHQNRYDIVVLDYAMPKLTGLDVAKGISKVREDIPIIMYTGLNEVSPDECHASGVRRLLLKPLNAQALSKAIREVLDDVNDAGLVGKEAYLYTTMS